MVSIGGVYLTVGLREDAPSDKLPPWGSAVLNAIDYTQRFDSLESFIMAYQTTVAVDALKENLSTKIDDQLIQHSVISRKMHLLQGAVEVPLPRTIITPPERSKEPIAIVGMGCRLPKANSIAELETLLRNGTYAIQEVPIERWDHTLFWDSDPKAADKTYSKIGGFIEQFAFEPKRFRIPPKVASQIDLVQTVDTDECRRCIGRRSVHRQHHAI